MKGRVLYSEELEWEILDRRTKSKFMMKKKDMDQQV